MSRRDSVRCGACRMLPQVCICSLMPTVHSAIRVVLVIHEDEALKPTNTGLLAARCLVNSAVVVVPGQAVAVDVDERAALLFPAAGARSLASFAELGPRTLVVPDGSWRQARKMRSRVAGLAALPCVTLPPGPPTEYRLRTERRAGGLATLEAIARALALLGDTRAHDALLAVFRVMVERTLATRGLRARSSGIGA